MILKRVSRDIYDPIQIHLKPSPSRRAYMSTTNPVPCPVQPTQRAGAVRILGPRPVIVLRTTATACGGPHPEEVPDHLPTVRITPTRADTH
jgi:hypothetical protein